MSTLKEFKILRITESKNDFSGIEIIIAELSEIQKIETVNNSLNLDIFSKDSNFFVFSKYSAIAEDIFTFPQNNVVLDLCNFKEQEFSFQNYNGIALFHKEYLEQHRNQLNNYEENELVEGILEECLLMQHTDMYFLSIFRYIIYVEYEITKSRDKIDFIVIFDKFKKLCSYLLMKICKVQTNEYEQLTSYEKSYFGTSYDEIIEYGKQYLVVIPTFVMYREYVQLILNTELNNQEPDFPIFIQRCFLHGYETALRRVSDNLNNKNFLNHEFLKTDNSLVIKIFLTPSGFVNKEILVQLATSGKFNEFLDNYFKEFDIHRVYDEQLKNDLGTSLIYRVIKENKLFYFQRRPLNDEYVPFGEQDRKTPLKTLIVRGQLNLTAID